MNFNENSLSRSSLFGKNEPRAKTFDDSADYMSRKHSDLKEIVVRSGVIIDSITFKYSDISYQHGGNGGGEVRFALLEGEHLVKVRGNYTRFSDLEIIESLVFETDKGRVFSVGGAYPGNNYFEFKAPDKQVIVAMFGQSGVYLNNIGFCTMNLNLGIKDIIGSII